VIRANPSSQDLGSNLLLLSSVFKLRSEELLGLVSYSELALQRAGEAVPFARARALAGAEAAALARLLKAFYASALQFTAHLAQVFFT
jgi:hypothetical protein